MAAIFPGGRDGAWRKCVVAGKPAPVIVDGTLEVSEDGSQARCVVCVNGRYYEVEGPLVIGYVEGSEMDDETSDY
ncbi:MAG: hypothetical protein PVI21_06200 [Candidatus Woesebacteria bacterium]